MRIQAASGCSDEVARDPCFFDTGVVQEKRVDPGLALCEVFRIGRTFVAPRRAGGIVVHRRGTRPEILVRGKGLSDVSEAVFCWVASAVINDFSLALIR